MVNKKIILSVIIVAAVFVGWQILNKQTKEMKNVDMLSNGDEASVLSDEVSYFGGIKGYFVKPKESGNYPGVVMIHEWWGLNENIKQMARQLASEGYNVLAVDLHKGKVAATAEEARALVSSLDQQEALRNLRAAVSFLRNQDSTKIASLGWCFGGGQSLQLALSGEDLDATVIYYGQLISDKTRLSNIKWPVLGIFGDKDSSIPVSSVYDFRDALTFLSIPNEVHIYPGVGHAFANPSGANYAPQETTDAWTKTLTFLAENLK
ncbi:dienelactone hydrolase family protein [Candidatus Parcubacteria bacterium]|nr:MAG: dienelactone hydrolase family protein [Candidatus Parcubacteria bacterium]